MGLVRREVPFGESERTSRRSLYKIDDPFFRLWFRVVAPHRGLLAASARQDRLSLLRKHWGGLAGHAWEELCRWRLPFLRGEGHVAARGPWGPAGRWWRGQAPEWDVVSRSVDGEHLLLGEVKWSARPFGVRDLERLAANLRERPAPSNLDRGAQIVRALFLPELTPEAAARVSSSAAPLVVTAREVLAPDPSHDRGR